MNRKLLDSNKQGMQDINIKQINQIITDQTYNSAKYLLQQDKQQKAQQKATQLQNKLQSLDKSDLVLAQNKLNITINLLQQQFVPKIFCVCDFDCFYAAIEMRRDPSLKAVPLAVCGGGIVCASNYAARKFGVRSATPAKVAKALCDNIKIVQADIQYYQQVSRSTASFFMQFDPNFTMLSCDECLMELSGYIQNQNFKGGKDGSTLFIGEISNIELLVAQICREIRGQIEAKFQLTVSCGVGISVQLAKINADRKKPNGQTISQLHFHNKQDMFSSMKSSIGDLEIRKIWGIGQATAEMLTNKPFQCIKIKDIQDRGYQLVALLPPSIVNLIASAYGLGQIHGQGEHADLKSVGHAKTFPEKEQGFDEIIMELCKDVCLRLQVLELIPRRIQIQIRFADWSDQIKVKDLPTRSSNLSVIYETSVQTVNELVKYAKINKRGKISTVGIGQSMKDLPSSYVRLIGVRAIEFEDYRYGEINEFIKVKPQESNEINEQSSDFEVVGFVKGSKQKTIREQCKQSGLDKWIKKK
ncbi:DNA polymerase kappa-related protein [Spironucleus salmonicida]|uniref:DNA polymerase kappa n=1 Tax=Spironucleus salmonicida TaxID=348837 RepID=V6LMZ2_9EUKA|nr:DNA polymerase kappa-related protein [Spironucleus salmonicida]|eukprot:EST46057.1 DNA polymerase kappa-related protein [Spironucleus salmonicida]